MNECLVRRIWMRCPPSDSHRRSFNRISTIHQILQLDEKPAMPVNPLCPDVRNA